MTKPPPEAINVPIKLLSDDFKKKHKRSQSTMTNFAPIDCQRPCPSAKKEVRDQLYITDNKVVYEWASKKTLVFRIFKLFYWFHRWSSDGFSLAPTWHSVLYVDDIVKDNKLIHVTDTLVLHIDTISSFEKLIPFICGPFTRLTIHGGDIKLDQLKRLMKDMVRKVEITAEIELKSDEYDDAVRLIKQHVRGFRYNFNLESTPQLITEVKSAVQNDRNLHAKDNQGYRCNVIHWKMRWVDLFIFFCRTCFAMLYLYLLIYGLTIFEWKNVHFDEIFKFPTRVESPSAECCKSSTLSDYLCIGYLIMCFILPFFLNSKPDL